MTFTYFLYLQSAIIFSILPDKFSVIKKVIPLITLTLIISMGSIPIVDFLSICDTLFLLCFDRSFRVKG